MKQSSRVSLLIALFVVFMDFVGIGLIYPLISPLLFNPDATVLPRETSPEMRGLVLGFLIMLYPLANFIGSPLWGAISDGMGRKKPLQYTLILGAIGYCASFIGFSLHSLSLLIISRLITGFAAGNLSIIQAAITDISSRETRTKNFGLYTTAIGIGLAIGPLMGGFLSTWGFNIPILVALTCYFISLVVVILFFEETKHSFFKKTLSWNIGFKNLKKALELKEIRTLLFSYFLHLMAWSYFWAFSPIFLIKVFQFTSVQMGYFYGAIGAFYALGTGLFIRPFVSRFKAEKLFFSGNTLAACAIFGFLILPSSFWIWPLLAVLCFFVSLVVPTAMTLIADASPSESQGETLGILNSVRALALIIAPSFSGAFVGQYPFLSMVVSGSLMIFAGLVLLLFFRRRLFS